MRRFAHILPFLLLAALLSAGACRRLPGVGDEEEYGTLTLQIGTGVEAAWTKADPDPQKDGDVFHNILVIVAEKDGTVVDKVYKEYPCTGSDVPPNQEPKDVESTDSDWIYFINLKVGYYQVYAYANIDEPEWQIDGQSVESIEKNLIESGHLDSNRQFTTLSGSDAPVSPLHCMLLTGHDELYVGVDPYIGRIDLVRPVVKFEVILDNHTPFHLQLTDLHFNNFNASDSYLLGRKDADGDPVIPENNNYRPLPAFDGPSNVPSNTQKTVYSQFLYENCLGQDYRMFATVQFADENGRIINNESGAPLVDSEDSTKPLSKTMTSASVRHVPFEDIRDLPRGGSMNVLVATPNTGNGGFLGYMQTGQEQRIVFSSATYNFEESFRSKAEALLVDKEVSTYYQLKLTKESDTDKYHLYRDTRDLFSLVSGATVNGLFLAEGFIPTEYPISQEFTGSLCRFTQTNASNANSLFYNNLQLKLDKNANYGNRMWTFYEIHPEGTVLKLIDRESSRVSTLTRMVRGQKLTAVMNVYFESETGEFTFSLDNTYWEDGHHPKYTFE